MSTATAFNAREFRNALGCFATGITIVSVLDGAGQAEGITVNSFSAVSLSPPLVLWCIGRSADRFALFEQSELFTVSVLDEGAAEMASRFAMKGEHRVDSGDTVPTHLGPPTFAGAIAVFECETYARYDGGDHLILVGRVRDFSYARGPKTVGAPLLFYRGRYGRLTDLKP